MDRALKERVVGATVLVVIAVLVVPVFLDGSTEEVGMVTETVTLPGQSDQDTRRQTIVLERDREQPVPLPGSTERTQRDPSPSTTKAPSPAVTEARKRTPVSPPVSEPKATPAEKKATETAKTPPPTSKPAATTPAPAAPAQDSATGMWAVQLGSFSNQANAENLAAALRKQGYAAFLSRVQTSASTLHRVRVGPQQNRESAEKVATQLSGDGHKGQVVPHP